MTSGDEGSRRRPVDSDDTRDTGDGGTEAAPKLGPAELLGLIERQRAAAVRQMEPDRLLVYLPWGIAWLVGYGVYFLRYGTGAGPILAMPPAVPALVMVGLIAAALLVTGYAGMRSWGDVLGPSRRQGGLYGLTWLVGFAFGFTFVGRFAANVPEAQQGLLWGGVAAGITGLLYVAGAAIWQDRHLLALGLWISTINLLGIVAVPRWYLLVMSLLGGGGLIVAGFVMRLHQLRAER